MQKEGERTGGIRTREAAKQSEQKSQRNVKKAVTGKP